VRARALLVLKSQYLLTSQFTASRKASIMEWGSRRKGMARGGGVLTSGIFVPEICGNEDLERAM